MSDRFPQYPQMIPNFPNSSLLQQQQQQAQQQQQQHQQQQQQQHQQQAQHQQLQPQSDPHPPYPDQNRMWQQQMQYRPRSGMDINQQSQQPQQIQEMLRARQQQMSQQGQPQPQPQFGLGMSPPQMSAAGPMNPQQPPFPDTSNNQSQPSHIPPTGFPGMGPMSNQNPGLNAASIPQRNPGLLGGQNAGSMNRQLELIMAQQPQNNILFNNVQQKMNQQNQQVQQQQAQQAQQQQQQQQAQQQAQQQQQQRDQQQQPQSQLHPPGINHPNPADIFAASPALSSEALRRPSPSHPANLAPQIPGGLQGSQQPQTQQQPPQAQQQQPIPGGPHHPGAVLRRPQPFTLQEVSERLRLVRSNIVNIETELRSLFSQGQLAASPEIAAKMRVLQADLKNKQEMMSKLALQQRQITQNGAMAHMVNHLGGAPGQPSWTQNAPGQVFERGAVQQQMPPSLHQQGPNGIQSNNALQSQANLMAPGGVPRPGQGQTPQGMQQAQQQLGSPFAGPANIPTSMANKPPFMTGFVGMNPGAGGAGVVGMQQRAMNGGGGPSAYPPALDKMKLDSMLPGFLQRKGVKIDPSLLTLNDSHIDLAHLHALVISEGGFQKVSESETWNVIGGRMGFVNFPGSEREPSKCGPVVAQHLAHVYREYLLDLELTYVRTWHASNNQPRPNLRGPMNHPGVPGMPNGMTVGINGQPQRMSPAFLQYAHLSVAELRQRGVPDNVISVVEQNRAHLQRTAIEQKQFHQQVRMNARNAPPMAGMAGDANGMQPPNQGGNMNDPNQQGPAGMLRHQLVKPPMMGGVGVNNGMQQPMAPANSLMLRPEATRMAIETINRMKDEFKRSNYLSRLVQLNVDVQYEQRAEFNPLLETAHRQCQDMNDKLHMIHLLLPGITSRAITITNIISTQRHLLANGQPRYVVSLDHLRSLSNEVHRILEAFSHQQQQLAQRSRLQAAAAQQQQQHPMQQPLPPQMPNQQPAIPTHPGGPHSHPQIPQIPNSVNGSAQSPPGSNIHHPSPSQQPALQHQPPPQPQQPPMSIGPQQGMPIQQQPQAPSPPHVQPNRTAPMNLHPPPVKRPTKNVSTPSNTAPSPAATASASTPAPPNAPTPTPAAASPSAPKSPKTRPKPKQTAGTKRKLSSVPSAQPHAANHSQGPEQMQAQTSSSASTSTKRPREEDTLSGNMAPSPAGMSGVVDQPSPPKRAKVEWDAPPSEELQAKKAMVENVKTEEDTTIFLAQMTEFFKMAGVDSQQDPDFSTAELSMFLKGCTQVPGNPDDLNSFVTPLEPPSIPPIEDGLEQYFDFSLGATQEDGDDDSKTPELVSSSTTNTSPGSNSGNESTAEGGAPATNEIKTEDPVDFTRLGSWKEIDGGESAFYQTNDWKYDSVMPTLEQPWAIFMS